MNIQEYISSGIVESYVLGLASPDERAEFEAMCAAHAEVRLARDSFERSLEKFSLANAQQPPAHLRDKIFAGLDIAGATNSLSNSGMKRELPAVEDNRVVRINNSWRWLAAASVLLLLTSTALNFYFFRQYKQYNARYDELLARQGELVKNSSAIQARMEHYEAALTMMKDTNMSIIRMAGSAVPTSPDPASLATIYWNKQTRDVYLIVNKMPVPASDKQYQLWAIVDGKPVDAGVFDITGDAAFVKMKNIPRAQAFAVTLEKRGGSEKPTLELMYVLGTAS